MRAIRRVLILCVCMVIVSVLMRWVVGFMAATVGILRDPIDHLPATDALWVAVWLWLLWGFCFIVTAVMVSDADNKGR